MIKRNLFSDGIFDGPDIIPIPERLQPPGYQHVDDHPEAEQVRSCCSKISLMPTILRVCNFWSHEPNCPDKPGLNSSSFKSLGKTEVYQLDLELIFFAFHHYVLRLQVQMYYLTLMDEIESLD